MRTRIPLPEALGLIPFGLAVKQSWRGLRGDPFTPPHKWGLSTLRTLRGKKSIEAWLGRARSDRRVPMFNLFNRVEGPPHQAHSVRSTYARDFHGGRQTYDGHWATDFILPIGTPVVAAAPGRVVRVAREYDRGGLHVSIDHGQGVFTDNAHLGRALVRVGEDMQRGQPVALSGAAGLDLLLGFPWNPPHLHYNVWLNGRPVDPFARLEEGELAMWRNGNDPVPHTGDMEGAFTPTQWVSEAVKSTLESCRDPEFRAFLASREPLGVRASEVLFHRNYRPTRFTEFTSLYPQVYPRQPLLDLPFHKDDFIGISWE